MPSKILEVENFGKVEINFNLKANRQIQVEGTPVLVGMRVMQRGYVASTEHFVNMMVIRPAKGEPVPNDSMIDVVFSAALKLPEGKTPDELIEAWIESGRDYMELVEEVRAYFHVRYPRRETTPPEGSQDHIEA
jgi:hypothetical protein